jgi:hypothetical protein
VIAKVARGEQSGEAEGFEGFEATVFALTFSPTGAAYRRAARIRGSPLWVELNVPDGRLALTSPQLVLDRPPDPARN